MTYIEKLVEREKKARDPVRAEVVAWHEKRVRELESAVNGAQRGRIRHYNAKIDKFKLAIGMHRASIELLKGVDPRESEVA